MSRELTYDEVVDLYKTLYGEEEFASFESAWANWGQTVETEDIVEVLNARGDLRYGKWVADSWVAPTHNGSNNITGYTTEFDVAYSDVVDSNEVIRGKLTTPVNTTTEVIEGRNVMSAKVGLREAGKFAIGSVVPAVAAAGIGITLGKTIDSTLYNLNPDFWDAHGMSSLDPSTWSSITAGDDGISSNLFDMIFGIDSNGNTQAYIDEDALTYLTWWLQKEGFFNTDSSVVSTGDVTTGQTITGLQTMTFAEALSYLNYTGYASDYYGKYSVEKYPNATVILATKISSSAAGSNYTIITTGHGDSGRDLDSVIVPTIDATVTRVDGGNIGTLNNTYQLLSSGSGGFKFWYVRASDGKLANTSGTAGQGRFHEVGTTNASPRNIPVPLVNFELQHPIDGIGSQPDATLPDTTTWNDLPSTKQSLQQQYPTLWDNAKHQDYVDENGQNRSKTLIPINLPDIKNITDIQPTSGNRKQSDPQVDPTTATKDLIDTITKLITGTPWINPPTTGGGGSPTVVAPTGNASSLWAIYNPTQAQVDAFGAWLWSSSFVDQIKKLFNDPMQAIIGIHKVFATPSIGGTATIKVGYLDSQVPSDYIDNQYTTVNCGTVNLNEYFGNVFDYSPYTRVSLYLPFIGIVDLDVADVMRSSINVTYHVDVLSGACLADVTVTRDLGSAVLYQYSGSAIVTYPVSSGNYMGMVAGVLSVAGGVLGTIASGGALAPALIGGAVGASHLHTNVSHSGGFSGCAGAMAGKIPYLIISRPQTAMADNYGHFTGKPANSHVILRNCSGMTRVKSVYVGNMNATDEEKDMIEAQLKAGVLI